MDERIYSGFSEVWSFYKRNYVIQDSQREYDRLMEEASTLAAKYEGCDVVWDLLTAVLKDIDRNTRRAAQTGKTE